jgi:tRNA pseudouridine55 synthase
MDGILVIDKSRGETSFGVVAAVRRLCRERRVGHAGTLDPLATGVLPVCLGKATRVVEYLMEHPKKYRAEVEFGLATDTGDAEGQIVGRGDVSAVSEAAVSEALERFRGSIQQTPPMFSALKHHGRRLYEMARAGITVDRPSRTVEIHDIGLVSWNAPVATIEVTCSRGTYIRSLAQDLGHVLGCGAYLKNLSRVSYGPFDIARATSVPQLAEAVDAGELLCLLSPVDSVMSHLPALTASVEEESSIRHGRPFSYRGLNGGAETAWRPGIEKRCRAYSLDGRFIGVLRFNSEKDEWQPEKVFL